MLKRTSKTLVAAAAVASILGGVGAGVATADPSNVINKPSVETIKADYQTADSVLKAAPDTDTAPRLFDKKYAPNAETLVAIAKAKSGLDDNATNTFSPKSATGPFLGAYQLSDGQFKGIDGSSVATFATDGDGDGVVSANSFADSTATAIRAYAAEVEAFHKGIAKSAVDAERQEDLQDWDIAATYSFNSGFTLAKAYKQTGKLPQEYANYVAAVKSNSKDVQAAQATAQISGN